MWHTNLNNCIGNTMQQPSTEDVKIQAYIGELREQSGIISERAAQLSAALAEERMAHARTQHELSELKAANEEVDGAKKGSK